MAEIVAWPIPDWIHCTRCGYRGTPDVFTPPHTPVGDEAFVCQGKYGEAQCGMDESGLTLYWNEDTLKSWREQLIAEIVDKVKSGGYDDRMMNASTDDPAPRTIPDRIPAAEARNARAEIKTNPDAIELAEGIAEQVRALIWPSHNDALEDWVMEACVDELPTFREHHMSPDSDPNDDNYTKLEGAAYDLIVDIFHRELLVPMLMRIIKTGDWRRQTEEN